MFWMNKIQSQSIHYKTMRHSFVRRNYKNKAFSSNWYRFCKSLHVSQHEKTREICMHTSFHMQFNKSNSFCVTARSNHRWVHKTIKEINYKKRMSWNNTQTIQRLKWQLLNGSRSSTNRKFLLWEGLASLRE